MKQTRRSSLIESLLNIAIGLVVGFCSQLVVFPFLGMDVAITTNMQISLYFTMISLARSYVIRRWFNERLHRTATALSEGRIKL